MKWDPERFIHQASIINGIILGSPHLLLGGESGSGKSRVLYGLIYKILRGDNKDNLFICDGKGRRIIQRWWVYFRIYQMLVEQKKKYLITSKM